LNSHFDLSSSPSVGVYIGGVSPNNKVSNVVMTCNIFNGPADKICNPWKIGGSYGSPLNAEVEGVSFEDNEVYRCSIPINLQNADITDILLNQNTFRETDGVLYVWTQDGSSPTGVLSDFVFTNNDIDSTNSYSVAFFDTDVGVGDASDTLTDSNFGSGNLINYNLFDGIPGAYGLEAVSYLGAFTAELNAEYNYWGCSKGPEDPSCSSVSEDVDYDPWAYDSNLNIDTSKPDSTINSPDESSWQNEDFQVSITDEDSIGTAPDTAASGLDVCKYRVYSNDILTKDWTVRDCNLPLTITVGPGMDCQDEGEDICKVQISAEDIAGNNNWAPGYYESRLFSIDFTNPTPVSIIINEDNEYTSSESVYLTLEYNDAVSLVKECRYSNEDMVWSEWEACSTSKSWMLTSEDGEKTVYYEVKDNAGNIASDSDTITLDTQAPTISDATGDIIIETGETIEICANVIDDGSGIDVVLFNYNSDLPVEMDEVEENLWCYEYTAPENPGEFEYFITAEDEIEQESTSETYIIQVVDLAIYLAEGWNLISLPVVPEDTSIEAVLGDADVSRVYAYDLLDENADDGWLMYTNDIGDTLQYMTVGFGYWILADSNTTIIVNEAAGFEDHPPAPPSRNLARNWNLLGISGDEPKKARKALWSVDTKFKAFDKNIDLVEDLMPKEGYWLAISHSPGSYEEDYYIYYP
jgi:hypothetical protein